MKQFLIIPLLVLAVARSFAADTVTVDPAGVLVVAGAVPAAPAVTEVRIGGGQVRAGGSIVAGNIVVDRTAQAAATEVVRGDDPRLAIDAVTEVAITATTTLSSTAFGKSHVISGTSVDYTVTLPTAVGSAGKQIQLRVKPWALANKQFQIACSGAETMDGRTALSLIHTNFLTVRSDGANWVAAQRQLDTNWVDATPVGGISISATVTAPVKGPTVRDKVYFRRVGQNAELNYAYQQSAATGATAGSGLYLLGIPFGTIDTAIIPGSGGATSLNRAANCVGSGHLATTASNYTCTGAINSTSRLRVAPSQSDNWGSTQQPLNTAGGVYMSLQVSLPMSGW